MPLPRPGDLYFVGGEWWMILEPVEPFVDETGDGRIYGWHVMGANQTESMPPMEIYIPRKDLMARCDRYMSK